MAVVGENWKCPYCGHAQVLADERFKQVWHRTYLQGWKKGNLTFAHEAIACANEECRELTFAITIATYKSSPNDRMEITGNVKRLGLLPPSSAKPQPEFIPQPIRDDYYEACAIRDLSPKASATLTRRCLQGMIRDFCGISKKRLIDELKELRSRAEAGNAIGVQLDSIDAIDHVREVGNIGAHMEADINVIVDVDPDEAQILIGLVELLFDEWYVAREARKHALAKLKSIATNKKGEKQQPLANAP